VDWEIKGVPVRVEVGPRDLAQGSVTLVRRDTRTKEQAAILGLPHHVETMLHRIQDDLLAAAEAAQEARTAEAATVDEAAALAQEGLVRVPWRLLRDERGEDRLKEHGVTVRCLRRPDGGLPLSEDEPDTVAVVARAY
jgi:prolyl-tRNA synthetase